MTDDKKTGPNKPPKITGTFVQIERGAEKEEIFEEISCLLDDMCEEGAPPAAPKPADENRVALNRPAPQQASQPATPPAAAKAAPKKSPSKPSAVPSKPVSANAPSWPIKNIPPMVEQSKSKGSRTILFIVIGVLIACAAVAAYLFTRNSSMEPPPKTQVFKIAKESEAVVRKKIVFPEHMAVLPKASEKTETPNKKQVLKTVPTPPESKEKTTIPAASNAKSTPRAPAIKTVSTEQQIKQFLTAWKTAWENTATDIGDIDTYMDFYSESFKAKGFTKRTWRRNKALKNRYKSWIKVNISNIRISGKQPDGSLAVTFTQRYRSSNYQDKTEKTLIIQREKGSWKIIGLR